MFNEIFTSSWFWFAAIAYAGAGFGGYIASKDPDMGIIGLFSKAVRIAVYVFVLVLFWQLPKWYLPIIVLLAILAFDMVLVFAHALITHGTPSASSLISIGILGTIAGIVFIVLAYVNLL